MRVLIVVHGFPPKAEGGSEVYVAAQARALARVHGDTVLVLTREADPSSREYAVRTENRDGLTIVWINNTFREVRSFEDSYQSDRIAAIVRGVIDEFKPDVAHVHHLTCLSTGIVPALAERGIPCFFTLHDYWLMCHRGQLFDLDRRVCSGPGVADGCGRCLGLQGAAPPSAFVAARALRMVEQALPQAAASVLRGAAGRVASLWADGTQSASAEQTRLTHMRGIAKQVTRFLAPSQYIREQFIRLGIPAEQIVHAPYGFERDLFPARRPTAVGRYDERATHKATLRLGFVGSLMVSKAPHLIIEAARRFESGAVTVDLYGPITEYHGDDSYRSQLAPLLALDGVRHHGPVAHAGIPSALAELDALVVPSVWPENSPLVIQEAFLAGIPVIASRIGGIPELVEHGRNGLLFEPGDVDGLHRAIARLRDEPDLRDRLQRGIGPVRTIEDDVASVRALFREQVVRDFSPAVIAEDFSPAEVAEDFSPATAVRPVPDRQRTAAVVLNYRTPDDTFLAVRSLMASRTPFTQIIVVDNDVEGSDRVGEESAIHIRTGRNLGFSGGVNVGIRAALETGADAVLLVNSDAIVPPDCLERLERALASIKGSGIAGPTIAARCAPADAGSQGISYNTATGRMRHQGVGQRVAVSAGCVSDPHVVDAVSGCVMLVTRDVFDAVGVFDDDYFFSFEDIDFCLRARTAGFLTVLARDAIAYHEGGRSIGSSSPERLYFAARNHLLLARRTAPAASALARAYQQSAIVALNVGHAMIAGGGSMPRRLAAVMRGTRDYLAARYGPGRSFGVSGAASDPRARRPRSS